MSLGPDLAPFPQKEERNWVPFGVAIAIMLSVAAVAILILQRENGHARSAAASAPISAPLDPYAASLSIAHLAMSESGNLAGGKLTYLDGNIANQGARTITGVEVQVLFRDPAHEVAQNQTLPLMLIRTREPYIDLEPVSAAPLKPGSEQDFRLIFDSVSPDWDGAYPEILILHVETK